MLLLSLSLLAYVSAAPFPLTEEGCQCLGSCEYCSTHYNVIDCGSWQLTKLCEVNGQTCTDYQYKNNGKVADKCGHLTDIATEFYTKVKAWFVTPDKIKDLAGKIQEWDISYIHDIDVSDLLSDGAANLARISDVWEKLDTTQLAELKAATGDQWDKIVQNIPADRVAALSTTMLDKLTSGQREKIQNKIKNLQLSDVATWTKEQWDRVPIENLATMSWEALQKVPIEELGAWTQDKWKKIPVDKLVKLSGEQIGKIDAADATALTNKYWDKAPVYHVMYYGAGLLQSAGVLESMNRTYIAYLTAEQWKKIPVEAVTKFSVEKLQAVDYHSLAGWTQDKWDKVPIDTLANFTGKQIEAIPAGSVGKWSKLQWQKFNASKAVMFTGTQLAAGANALKDLSEKELAKYDWEQLSQDARSKLPQELQDKITKLQTAFNMTKYKDLVSRATVAKSDKDKKLEQVQITNADPAATDGAKAKAQTDYEASVVASDALEMQLNVQSNSLDGIVPRVASLGVRAALTTSGLAVLLGALSM